MKLYVLKAKKTKSPEALQPRDFSLGRGDAIRTRNQRFWRPLLYR